MSDFNWFLAKEHHGSDLAIHFFDITVQLEGPTPQECHLSIADSNLKRSSTLRTGLQSLTN